MEDKIYWQQKDQSSSYIQVGVGLNKVSEGPDQLISSEVDANVKFEI